ncbi:MAG: signal peptide peptidase SppA [candidate division Zixibacteria bacterium RBG_16_53_22]|nr:MAG: signal peptide peptidase SppA [candidate division Zixibacteria bacterium RBG_16_53_22]
MKHILIIAAFLHLSFIAVAAADPFDGMEHFSESAATADRAISGLVNPAGLGSMSAMGIQYAHAFTDSTYGGDDGALFSSKTGFFGIEWLNHTDNIFRRKYTLSLGDRIYSNFYMGLSYSWLGGSDAYYKGRKDWKVGFLYHPRPFASLALVVDRLNQPKFGGTKQERLYQPAAAIRPFGDEFTFSTDIRWLEGEDISSLDGNFRFAAGPFRGVSFITDYRTEGQWRFGMTFNFDESRLGAQGRLVREHDFAGGNYFMEVGTIRYTSTLANAGKTGSLTLDGNVVEEPGRRPIFGKGKEPLYAVISQLRRGANDPRIAGLLLKIDDVSLDFATAQELREAIGEYRANNKKVTAFMVTGGNLHYYLASAADEIYMDPGGLLELRGLAATAKFYKGTMDKLGIRADVVRTGPHKTFADAYTDTALTDAAKEQIEWLLDDLYGQFVDGIAIGRRILPEKVKTLIDSGPYTAQDAFAAGLVDGLRHYDEFVENDVKKIGSNYAELGAFYRIEDYNPRWSEPKKIAIVYANGTILPGRSGSSLLEGKIAGSKTLAGALKRVREDGSIRAVVFRVNSPGGDVFASEEIYRQLELIKGRKPLVVSMGGVAASGGYYVASPGDAILASPGTITGSIGVVMGKPDLSGFYEKVGVSHETIRRGAHADIRSTDRAATDEEIALIERIIWQYYDDFVMKVATWRKLGRDSVDAIGQGRVWTGRQALERGLVDSYGGIWEAVELARQKARIDSEDRLEFMILPTHGISIFPPLGIPSLEAELSSLLERAGQGGLYFKQPFTLKIE